MVKSTASNDQKLFRLLIAAAWIDGEFQTAEREYLHKLAAQRNLLEQPEIKFLLSNTKPIESETCYQWLSEYLGAHPTIENYQSLFAEIAGVLYADGYIATEEAKLLNQLQALDPSKINSRSALDIVVSSIRELYRKDP